MSEHDADDRTERIPLDDLIVLDEVQVRVDPLDSAHADQIAMWLRENPEADTDPVDVFLAGDDEGDDAGGHFVGGGFHRTEGYRRAERKDIPCKVRPGGRRAAMMFSAADAGRNPLLPYSRADRRRAAEMVLGLHPEWPDRQIADYLKFISRTTVGEVRADLERRGRIGRVDARRDTRGRMQPTVSRSTAPSEQDTRQPDDNDRPPTDFDPYQFDGGANDEPVSVVESSGDQDPTPPTADLNNAPCGRDGTGYPIPRHMTDVFRDESIGDMADELKKLAKRLKDSSSWNPHVPVIHTDLTAFAERIEGSRPYAVCRECHGRGCEGCMTKGFHPHWKQHELAVEYGQQPAA